MTTNPTRDRLEIPDVLDEMIGDTLCDVQTLREQVRKYLNEAHRAGYREGAADVSAAVEAALDERDSVQEGESPTAVTIRALQAEARQGLARRIRAAIDSDAARRHDAQVRAQALSELAEAVAELGNVWGGDAAWLTTGFKVADLFRDVINDRIEHGADHAD